VQVGGAGAPMPDDEDGRGGNWGAAHGVAVAQLLEDPHGTGQKCGEGHEKDAQQVTGIQVFVAGHQAEPATEGSHGYRMFE